MKYRVTYVSKDGRRVALRSGLTLPQANDHQKTQAHHRFQDSFQVDTWVAKRRQTEQMRSGDKIVVERDA